MSDEWNELELTAGLPKLVFGTSQQEETPQAGEGSAAAQQKKEETLPSGETSAAAQQKKEETLPSGETSAAAQQKKEETPPVKEDFAAQLQTKKETQLAEEKAKPQLTESMLTQEEQRMVDEFSEKIDIHDTNGILQYGVGTQKKMANFSENALKSVRTKDLGEVGEQITSLVTELKGFDTEEEERGFLGLFKRSGNKMTSLKAKYDKVEVNVDQIAEVLEGHQVRLMKDVAMLDKMYELNLAYFKELSMYILAGKKRLEFVRATELASAIEKANASNLPEDAQAAKDLESKCERFEKKIHDLELTRMIAIQTAPQIRLIQSSNTLMIEKIQSTVVNTIPLWKSQMVIALGVEHANEAARAQQQVTDMTNQLLRKNAERLKTATIESAKSSERGIVDLETLKTTNAALISTFDEVIRIQSEGRQRRRQAEDELNRMEQELKSKLLEIHK